MPNKTTVLVVDDSLVNLAVLDEMLERQNFNVFLANSGERALVIAKESHPDVILLDIVMRGWDGYQTCQKIKSDPDLNKIPILFLSGLRDTENKVRALEAGAVDYVSKPFQESELLARVRTHAELARLREGLEQEVANKTAKIQSLLGALQISFKKAQESSVLKTQFLRNISHEFRTPMNIILGMTEELIEETELNDEQGDIASSVLNAGKQLMEILSNMLNFAQQFEGEIEQEIVNFDVRELIGSVLAEFSAPARSKSLALTLDDSSVQTFTLVQGNKTYLQTIFSKLMDNAIKYTAAGEIRIQVKLLKELPAQIVLRFEVSDTGPGVSKDKQAHLFETFSQLDGSTTRTHDGMGMGLALAKLYCESLGGEIGLESETEKGSTFWFTISLTKAEL
ncbi:MAG: response regulator [Gammaproteobacteria bacterium]|nr:response regulator [Gammaproteobacteria bacterium]